MLEQLRHQLLKTLETTPELRREIVQLVGAIEQRTNAPRTFPSRQERRAVCGTVNIDKHNRT